MSHAVLRTCAPGAHPTGIAIDGKGDVFVAINSHSAYGRIIEYKGGLDGCKGVDMGLQFGLVSGIALEARPHRD